MAISSQVTWYNKSMPPGPAYNWLCVLNTSAEILSHIIRHRAAQAAPDLISRKKAPPRGVDIRPEPRDDDVNVSTFSPTEKTRVDEHSIRDGSSNFVENRQDVVMQEQARIEEEVVKGPAKTVSPSLEKRLTESSEEMGTETITLHPDSHQTPKPPAYAIEIQIPLERVNPSPVHSEPSLPQEIESSPPIPKRVLQSSRVPSSKIGRLFHYGGLAASLGYGAAAELLRRTSSSADDSQNHNSIIMTEANIRRLVSKLSQMRGAALKLGQFMSIQDTHLLPPDVDAIFRRVQDSAHYMPDSQLTATLSEALGPDWEQSYFASFDRMPFAAASIGQVHSAVLNEKSSPTGKEEPVAVKVQFPGIKGSIDSDLAYVRMLLTASRILPRGLFLDKTIQVMKDELADECSYLREASFLRTFRSQEYLGDDSRFKVPWVWEGSTDTVLVMQKVEGMSVGEANQHKLSMEDRNEIASRVLELCLKELFVFRTMQTDPNWTNFLWNTKTRQIELVDFGATRAYSKEFMDNWLRLLQAASDDDHDGCVEWSLKLGYLTGEENETMLNAHTASMMLLATPFKPSTPQPFSFGPSSQWAEITQKIRSFIPIMLQHRLTPPPRETYSLNRKLSGAFLLAARLDATVDTRALWEKVVRGYQFGE